MSRKSLSKKETTIWINCSNCATNILAKDRELHACNVSDVEPNYTFIRDNTLFSNQLTQKVISDDIRDINENKLRDIFFVHESIFPLCDLVLGDYVSIESPGLSNNAPIVRIAWPITSSIAAGKLLSVCDRGMFETGNESSSDDDLIKLSKIVIYFRVEYNMDDVDRRIKANYEETRFQFIAGCKNYCEIIRSKCRRKSVDGHERCSYVSNARNRLPSRQSNFI